MTPSLTLPQAANVTGLALSRDGSWLAAGNAAGTIQLWTLPGGQLFGTFGPLAAPADRLAFSPDGRLLASAHEDHTIRLWGVAGPATSLAALTGHTAVITGLAFSPDGATLASSSWDGTVRLWAEP